MNSQQHWPVLEKDDAGLLEEIIQLLESRVVGSAYSGDGSFAAGIRQLPQGLRSMAATHWLDLSLTLDSMTCHFGNFGEPGLVAETEAGNQSINHGFGMPVRIRTAFSREQPRLNQRYNRVNCNGSNTRSAKRTAFGPRASRRAF